MIPNIFFLGNSGLQITQNLQILNLTLLQGIMHIPKLAIPSLESPLLMRVKIPNPHIINDDIIHQRIPTTKPTNTYRYISACWFTSIGLQGTVRSSRECSAFAGFTGSAAFILTAGLWGTALWEIRYLGYLFLALKYRLLWFICRAEEFTPWKLR